LEGDVDCQQEYDDCVVEQRVRGEVDRASSGPPLSMAYRLLYHDIRALIRQIDRLRAQSPERATRDLLVEIVAIWDREFPPSDQYYASLGVTVLLAALEKLVFRAREEFGCEL
jgi:hypothetical protein